MVYWYEATNPFMALLLLSLLLLLLLHVFIVTCCTYPSGGKQPSVLVAAKDFLPFGCFGRWNFLKY
jgi:hypothetical protein